MKLRLLFENIRSTDDALKVLSLRRGYSNAELKKAYQRAAMKNHPDRGGSHEAMKDVNASYSLLSKRTGQTDASDFIRQTDDEIKQSGAYKGGEGTFSTTDDWEEWMIQSGREEMLKNIRAHQKKTGGEYEMPGERLNRLARDDGLLPSLSLVLITLGVEDYKFITPHRVKLSHPLPYNMDIDTNIKMVDDEWVPNDIGELGKKLEHNGIMKVVDVQKPDRRENMWAFSIKIPALWTDEYDSVGFTLKYGYFGWDEKIGKHVIDPHNVELRSMSYDDDNEKIGAYLKSLK